MDERRKDGGGGGGSSQRGVLVLGLAMACLPYCISAPLLPSASGLTGGGCLSVDLFFPGVAISIFRKIETHK